MTNQLIKEILNIGAEEFWTKRKKKLTKKDIKKFENEVDWDWISFSKKLSESFIEKFKDELGWGDWNNISLYQTLSEPFIEKFQDKVSWNIISYSQNLSEFFIEKYQDKVDWNYISCHQKLSESFIRKYKDKVDWTNISYNQKLSESFIEKYKNKVSWTNISYNQKLSESFIEKNKDKVNWNVISYSQILSEEFFEKYKLTKPTNSWLYTTKEEKKKYIKENTNYEIKDDHIIAYKSVRSNNYSVYNFQYKYEVGKTYTSNCDCNLFEDNSFGLSAWTKENALRYYSKGKLLKVKIAIKDIGAIVHDNKIRAFKIEILEEINE